MQLIGRGGRGREEGGGRGEREGEGGGRRGREEEEKKGYGHASYPTISAHNGGLTPYLPPDAEH